MKNFAMHVQLDAAEKALITAKLQQATIKKNGVLLRAGEVCRNIYFVNRGCLRIYHTDKQGADHNTSFCPENWWAVDISSFSHLVRQFDDLFAIEKEWCWSGTHYQRTANDWLANFDAHRDTIETSLRNVHGEETALWMRRWRWSLLATAGLFGYADGTEWGVSRYRMKAAD